MYGYGVGRSTFREQEKDSFPSGKASLTFEKR